MKETDIAEKAKLIEDPDKHMAKYTNNIEYKIEQITSAIKRLVRYGIFQNSLAFALFLIIVFVLVIYLIRIIGKRD